jgi:hypothetical protein
MRGKKGPKIEVEFCTGKGGPIRVLRIKKPRDVCCHEIKKKICGKGVKPRGLHILGWKDAA